MQLMAGSMIVLSSYMIDRNWSLYVNWCLVACLLLVSLLQSEPVAIVTCACIPNNFSICETKIEKT